MISKSEILMGREQEYPTTPELDRNLALLLDRLNQFRTAYGKPMYITSGYRPGKYNTQAHGAPNSLHCTLEACDFEDKSRELTKFCILNLKLLQDIGLWMESPLDTPTWVHLQTRAPKSGNRIFRA